MLRALCLLAVVAACGESGPEPVVDAGPAPLPATRAAQLILVVDDSGGNQEEQDELVDVVPALIRSLLNGRWTPDDFGPVFDFPPVTDLRIAVLGHDMGTGGFEVPTCREPRFGDDGLFSNIGNVAAGPLCEASYPRFRRLGAGDGALESVIQGVECVSQRGVGGCGFEQPLESLLKAVTPASSMLRFQEGTRGHGDGAHAGFFREDAVLAVLFMATEDDCSAADPGIFDPRSESYPGDLNIRCFNYPEAIHPVARYVEGLQAVSDPRRIVFVPLVGVPAALVPEPEVTPDWSALRAEPVLQARVNPDDDTSLLQSCSVPGRGRAFPPPRILAVADGLAAAGAHTGLASTCGEDYRPAAESLVRNIAAAMEAVP